MMLLYAAAVIIVLAFAGRILGGAMNRVANLLLGTMLVVRDGPWLSRVWLAAVVVATLAFGQTHDWRELLWLVPFAALLWHLDYRAQKRKEEVAASDEEVARGEVAYDRLGVGPRPEVKVRFRGPGWAEHGVDILAEDGREGFIPLRAWKAVWRAYRNTGLRDPESYGTYAKYVPYVILIADAHSEFGWRPGGAEPADRDLFS